MTANQPRRYPCLASVLFSGLAVLALGCAGTAESPQERERDFGQAVLGPSSASAGAGNETLTTPAPEPEEEEPASSGTRRALIIGVSTYAEDAIPALGLASADARAVYSFLISEGGVGLRPGDATLLLDGQATLASITRAIIDLNAKCTRDDTLLLYFAGHGTVDVDEATQSTRNFLVPHDARVLEDGDRTRIQPESGLAIRKLQELLEVNRSRRLLLILDACFSGGAGGRTISPVELDARQAAQSEGELEALKEVGTGRAVLTATAPNQTAIEVPALGHGLFTYYLLEAFSNDRDRDGRITVPEVYAHLYTRVRSEARKLGREQTPTLKQNVTGSFALRQLPRTVFKVGLTVRYNDDASAFEASAATDAPPGHVPSPNDFQAEVSAWDTRRPLFTYLLRFVNDPRAPFSDRLLPDGENRWAPDVTVSNHRRAFFPDPRDTGGADRVRLGSLERASDVLFVLVASDDRIDRAVLDDVERRAMLALAGQNTRELASRAASVFETEPRLRHVALRYLTVKHGTHR